MWQCTWCGAIRMSHGTACPGSLDFHPPLSAEEQIRARLAEAWQAGFDAADINTPRSRKGHWEPDSPRKGMRTWIPDPLPTNPFL